MTRSVLWTFVCLAGIVGLSGTLGPAARAVPPTRHRIEVTVYARAQHPDLDVEIRYRGRKLPNTDVIVSRIQPPVYAVGYVLLTRPEPRDRWIRIYVHTQSEPRHTLCAADVDRVEVDYDRRRMTCNKRVNPRGCAWDCRLREPPYR